MSDEDRFLDDLEAAMLPGGTVDVVACDTHEGMELLLYGPRYTDVGLMTIPAVMLPLEKPAGT